jgi:hypothetical protein
MIDVVVVVLMHAHMLKLHVKITSKKYMHLDLHFFALFFGIIVDPNSTLNAHT